MSILVSPAPVPPSTSAASDSSESPLISPPPPIHLQVLYCISIWTFKSIINTGLFLIRQLTPTSISQLKPLIKTYPVRPMLQNRMFIPPSTETANNGVFKYPVYFSIHGGGWTAGTPRSDDEFCSAFCRKHNIIVVSLDYRKAPRYKFPFPVMDISSIVSAILADTSLPIDVSKIAIGGFSAGGNLAFAACQMEELKGKISAAVGLYPVLDSSEYRETKINRRPKGKDVPIDGVGWTAEFLDWGYVPQGQDRRDPLLSPRYADRSEMPKAVFLLGAEWDMLCWEAEATAENLVVEGEERRAVEGEGWHGWVQGRIRWEMFRRQSHAFTHVAEWTKVKEENRVKLVDELYDRLGKWLKGEAWSLLS